MYLSKSCFMTYFEHLQLYHNHIRIKQLFSKQHTSHEFHG